MRSSQRSAKNQAASVSAIQRDEPSSLTFDERHFRAVTPLDGGSFTLLPTDE